MVSSIGHMDVQLFACRVIFHGFVVICRLFSIINIFNKFFQEHYLCVKRFGSRSGGLFIGPDLGANCLQRLSADDKSYHKWLFIIYLMERE